MPYGSKNTKNILKYGSGYMFIAEQASISGATTFLDAGYVTNLQVSQTVDTYQEADFSGQFVVNNTTIQSVEISGEFMERNADLRNIYSPTADKIYTIIILGANIDDSGTTKRETWLFGKTMLSKEFSYSFVDGKLPFKFVAMPVNAAFTATTSSMPSGWDISASSLSQAVGKFYSTTDETKA